MIEIRNCHYSHFTDEEIRLREEKKLAQVLTS